MAATCALWAGRRRKDTSFTASLASLVTASGAISKTSLSPALIIFTPSLESRRNFVSCFFNSNNSLYLNSGIGFPVSRKTGHPKARTGFCPAHPLRMGGPPEKEPASFCNLAAGGGDRRQAPRHP